MTGMCAFFHPSPLVGEGAHDAKYRGRMRGLHPRIETPHPSSMLRISATLSRKGRGEERPSLDNNPSSTALICSARYFELMRHCAKPPAMNQRPGWPVRVYS